MCLRCMHVCVCVCVWDNAWVHEYFLASGVCGYMRGSVFVVV